MRPKVLTVADILFLFRKACDPAGELVTAEEAARTLHVLEHLEAAARSPGSGVPELAELHCREAAELVVRLLLERDVLRFAFGAETMMPADPVSQDTITRALGAYKARLQRPLS